MSEEIKDIEIVDSPTNEELQEEKSSKKPKKRFFILTLLIIIGLVLGISYYHRSTIYVSTDNAYIEGHIISISPKVSGNIVKIHVKDNQKVEKGQLLVEIDPTDYEVRYEQAVAKLQAAIEKQKSASTNVSLTSITSSAAVEQASSAIEAARSNVDAADKQVSQARANIAQINADIESVKAEVDLAETNLKRYQNLYNKGAVSKQELDNALTAYRTTKAKLDAAQEKVSGAQFALQTALANKEVAAKSLAQAISKYRGLDTVPEQVSISDAQNRMAGAEIKQLQAAVKQAKLDLQYTKIYAPSSGRVTSRSAEIGAFVQTGQPLMSIVPDDRWIIANFKETQLTNMREGQPVFIRVDAYPQKVFKGKVDSIQASTGSKSSLFPPENAVGSFVKVVQRVPVKIIFTEEPDPQYAIVPGMSVVPEVKVK